MLQLGEGEGEREGEGMASWWERGWGRERRTRKLQKGGKREGEENGEKRVKSQEGIK